MTRMSCMSVRLLAPGLELVDLAMQIKDIEAANFDALRQMLPFEKVLIYPDGIP